MRRIIVKIFLLAIVLLAFNACTVFGNVESDPAGSKVNIDSIKLYGPFFDRQELACDVVSEKQLKCIDLQDKYSQ